MFYLKEHFYNKFLFCLTSHQQFNVIPFPDGQKTNNFTSNSDQALTLETPSKNIRPFLANQNWGLRTVNDSMSMGESETWCKSIALLK